MANSRNYSNTAVSTTLNGSITNVGVSVVLNAQTGMPTPPFLLSIEPDTANEEMVLVTAGSGTGGSPYTVTRAQDGTSAIAHNNGVTVQHRIGAVDFTDSRTHEATGTGVHGLDSVNLKVSGGNSAISGNIALSNTLTETIISKQYTISSAVAAGASYRIFAGGNTACTGTPTMTLKLKYGSTVINTVVLTYGSGLSGDWHIDSKLTFQSVGGSGNISGVTTVWAPGINTTFSNCIVTDAALVSGIATTSPQILSITGTWSAASSSNTWNTVTSSVQQAT